MRHAYLEVTYRKGRPVAAYYYLQREPDDTSVRTESVGGGMLVDYAADGRPLGIEISAPSKVSLAAINAVLKRLGQEPLVREDLAPLVAA